MPTGYSLPHDTPITNQVKKNSTIISNVSVVTTFHYYAFNCIQNIWVCVCDHSFICL